MANWTRTQTSSSTAQNSGPRWGGVDFQRRQ